MTESIQRLTKESFHTEPVVVLPPPQLEVDAI